MTNKQEISLGINPNLDPKKLDGYAWVKGVEGGMAKMPFMVDKPELMAKKESSVIKSMFDQVLKMGMVCLYLEIFCNDTRNLFYHTNPDIAVHIDSLY